MSVHNKQFIHNVDGKTMTKLSKVYKWVDAGHDTDCITIKLDDWNEMVLFGKIEKKPVLPTSKPQVFDKILHGGYSE